MSHICAAMSRATRTWASWVLAPRCGVAITRGWRTSGPRCSGGGSAVNTSSAAPATCPLSSAASSASSLMMPPRATFTSRTPRLHVARLSALNRLRVWSVSGVCTVMKSASASTRGSGTGSTPAARAAPSAKMGSYPITCMPIEEHQWATSRPIRPRPITPRVFPVSSVPVKLLRSHCPLFRLATACGMFLERARMWLRVSSAVEMVLPPGVFSTRIPAFVAAFRLMLSTPVPARPTSFSFLAAPSTSSVTFVPLLTTNPSYSPIIFMSSSWGIVDSASTSWPLDLKTSTQILSIGSLQRILASIELVLETNGRLSAFVFALLVRRATCCSIAPARRPTELMAAAEFMDIFNANYCPPLRL
mmetsp:Transcript_24775/g.43291  ORF Transcript_24775/g.43291 Transcript_24775/m.43291 type:complete len:361 (+) Transcript_24775:2350-3432(+)